MMKYFFQYLEKVHSTNAFLLERPEKERVGIVVYAGEQSAGKGMGANQWESEPGMNLTFSMGVDMSFLKAADQFLLSQAVPLGLLQVLDGILPFDALSVKWPNDLYYDNRKLCGILINSTIHADMMGVSVVGIGLNVNQMRFVDWPTNPISMKMILNHDISLEPLLRQLVEAVDEKIQLLRTPEGIKAVKESYLRRMYRYRQWADYLVDGVVVSRFVTGLDPFGRLKTIDKEKAEFVYDIKELRFL